VTKSLRYDEQDRNLIARQVIATDFAPADRHWATILSRDS